MKPITREEYYLAKIAGTWQGKTPEPVTIEEYYLATMAGDYSGNTPQPVTRLQYYMAKAAGVWGGSIPAPVTRLEYYWAAITGKEGHIPDPVTRQEYLLYAISQSNNDVINTVSGSTIIIADATEGRPFRGLRVFGKSTQDGAPTPEAPIPIVSAGEDGSIEVKVGGRNLFDGKFESGSIRQDNGENQDYADRIRTAGFIQIKPSTVYSIKLLETISFSVRWYDKDKKFIKSEATNTISQSPDNARYMRFLLLTTKLDTKCMVYAGSAPTPYEPYRDPQTLTLATPNGLPGIPVTKDGNYTDENGQQWICDEIDLERGKYVQRVKEVNPADYDDWILDDSTEPIRFKVNRIPDTINERKRFEVLSNRFVFNSENKVGVSFTYADKIYFYLPSTVTTVEQAKQWFVDNPTTLMYMLGTPIEINLTPEEIAAYKALRTYGPTTVITNDAGAGMEVTYVAER